MKNLFLNKHNISALIGVFFQVSSTYNMKIKVYSLALNTTCPLIKVWVVIHLNQTNLSLNKLTLQSYTQE